MVAPRGVDINEYTARQQLRKNGEIKKSGTAINSTTKFDVKFQTNDLANGNYETRVFITDPVDDFVQVVVDSFILEQEIDMANPTFSAAFDEIGGKVSAYMITEFNEGRLKDTNYATVQAQAINAIIQGSLTMSMQTDTQIAQTALVTAQKSLVDKQIETNEADRQIKLYQLATLLPDEHNKNLKNQDLVSAQILQQGVEKLYTEARTVVVTESRIDNLLLEDLKSQDTKLGTIGAGGLVPSTNDFNSANALRQVVYDRAKNPAGTMDDITFVAGTAYVKAAT